MALVAKKETEIHKLKDFEYERIQYTRQALLHFLNAQMLIHAKQFEMYADIFNQLEDYSEHADMLESKYQGAEWVKKQFRDQGANVGGK